MTSKHRDSGFVQHDHQKMMNWPCVQRFGRLLPLSTHANRFSNRYVQRLCIDTRKSQLAKKIGNAFLEKLMSTAAIFEDPSTSGDEKRGTHNRNTGRLTVNLPANLIEELKQLSEMEHVSMTELIRRAISAEKFLRTQSEEGNQILILEKNQTKPSKVVVFR